MGMERESIARGESVASGQWRVASEGEDFAQIKRAKGNIVFFTARPFVPQGELKPACAGRPCPAKRIEIATWTLKAVAAERKSPPFAKGAQDGAPEIPRSAYLGDAKIVLPLGYLTLKLGPS